LLIKNKRVFQPDHISYMVSNMSVTLKRFTGLQGFFTKISSIVSYGPENFRPTDEDRAAISEVFGAWPRLTRLNYNDQTLEVPGSFHALFTPITSHLTKLSLVRTQVCHSLHVVRETLLTFLHAVNQNVTGANRNRPCDRFQIKSNEIKCAFL